MKTTLPVHEVFGPVWQGEGPAAGRVAHFLRLGGCNLSCWWCDSAYTWNGTEMADELDWPQLAERLAGLEPDQLLVLTGGEPLMHQSNPLIERLLGRADRIHVETNGTIAPRGPLLDRAEMFMVSPKLNEQGDPLKRRIKLGPLELFASLARQERAAFKIVCATPAEVRAAASFLAELEVPRWASWIMPQGFTPADVMDTARAIAPTVLDHRLNLTLRQHVLLYGQERNR